MNLEDNIKVGMCNSREFTVNYEDTAEYIGNPGVVMLSTPAMIKYMELTSGDIVFPHLPDGFNPVGTMVCIKHLSKTPINGKITVKGTLIEAYYKGVLIGSGTYEQFVVELEKFLDM